MGTGVATYFSVSYVYLEEPRRKFNFRQYLAEPITDVNKLQANPDDMKTRMELFIMKIQTDFVHSLENEENFGKRFIVDRWLRKEGGGGITCVLQDGDVFEKAGVNISVVSGALPAAGSLKKNTRFLLNSIVEKCFPVLNLQLFNRCVRVEKIWVRVHCHFLRPVLVL